MARHGATHRVVITATDLNGTAAALATSYGANGPGDTYGALSAAAAASTTGTLKPFATMAAGMMAQFVEGFVKVKFSGTSTTDLTLGIGYDLASGTDKVSGYLAPLSVHASGSFVLYFPQEIADVDGSSVDQTYGTQESAALTSAISATNTLIKGWRKVFAVANDLGVVFLATGANLTDLLLGDVHLYFRIVDFTTI